MSVGRADEEKKLRGESLARRHFSPGFEPCRGKDVGRGWWSLRSHHRKEEVALPASGAEGHVEVGMPVVIEPAKPK
jgi:hypothetical protein